jgi:hypothetical protein
MNNQSGFQVLFRKKDLKIGFKIQEIGAFQEIDIGEILFQSGFQMIWKKLFALDQSRNYKSFQDVGRLLIFTDNLLMISLFLQNKVKESLEESLKFSIAGLKVDQCHSLKAIIHFQFKMKNL